MWSLWFRSGLGTALLVGESRDRSPPVLWLEIFSVATDGTMCPGVDSASKNKYQDTPEGKDLLEPLGPPWPVAGHLYLLLTVHQMIMCL